MGTELHTSNFTTSIRRVNLREYAYSEAGRSGGQVENLRAHLNEILHGHLVDDSVRIGLTEEEIRDTAKKIEEANARIEKLTQESLDIDQSQIPTIQENIERIQERINKLRIGDATEIPPEEIYNPLRFSVNLFFLVMLSAYLFVFYVSAIDSALFQNIGAVLTDPGKVTSYVFSNIFNPNVFSTAGEHLVFLVLAPFVFFGFGYAIHAVVESHYSKWIKAVVIVFIIAFTFLLDAGIAYKIHDSAQQALQLILTPTEFAEHEVVWYKSVNFYIVLLMGFITYVIWGVLLHTLLVEGKKKNVIQKKMAVLSEEIHQAEVRIEERNQRKSDIRQEINNLRIEKSRLEGSQRHPTLTKSDVELSIANFEVGWLNFLIFDSQAELRANCAMVFREFREINLPNYYDQ